MAAPQPLFQKGTGDDGLGGSQQEGYMRLSGKRSVLTLNGQLILVGIRIHNAWADARVHIRFAHAFFTLRYRMRCLEGEGCTKVWDAFD